VDDTGVLGQNMQQVTDKLNHIKLYRICLVMSEIQTYSF
jgi:hypothetical protein